jgi:hypothetical protein
MEDKVMTNPRKAAEMAAAKFLHDTFGPGAFWPRPVAVKPQTKAKE